MKARLILLLALGVTLIVARREFVVRGIRALDRRGGLFAQRGAGAYAAGTRWFRGLYDRVATDAAHMVGSRDALVIDIGSGPGDLLIALRERAPRAILVGIEPSETMRAIAAERGVLSRDGRAEQLPFEDATVDLVLSTLSSHHWEDIQRAFGEIRRVLRDGGEARIYDLRFAGYGPAEARRAAVATGIVPKDVSRTILGERMLGLRPYALITIRA
jgi:SAM-dependent methyltransferase